MGRRSYWGQRVGREIRCWKGEEGMGAVLANQKPRRAY